MGYTKALRLLLISFIFACQSLWASLRDHNYYPESLIEYIESEDSINSQELKNRLYETLSKVHLQTDNQRDVLVDYCPEKEKCVEQKQNISYTEARRYLFGQLHLDQSSKGHFVRDVYCQKEISEKNGAGPGKIPNPNVINCEHTWPQSKFSSRHSSNLQKTDLHHLFPTDSRANSSRGNIIFSDVNGSPLKDCSSSKRGKAVNSSATAFEPPDDHKGNVARALFYFSVRYTIPLSKHESEVLRRWHKLDPVDEHERQRNQQIFDIQGNRNPFIDDEDLVSLVNDF
jgi:deoxyribonuclease-1